VQKILEEETKFQRRAKKMGFTLRPKKHWKDAIRAPSVSKSRGMLEMMLSESLSSSKEEEPSKLKPTVNVGSEWRLVYLGPELSYACEGLVPDDALMREIPNAFRSSLEQEKSMMSFVPTAKTDVSFALQVIGIDYPIEEHSKLSEPRTFTTRPCMFITQMGSTIDDDADGGNTITTAAYSAASTRQSDAVTAESAESAGTAATTVRKITLSTIVYIPEDDVPDKSVLVKLKDTRPSGAPGASKVGQASRHAELKIALDDEWIAEDKATVDEKAASAAEHQQRMAKEKQAHDLESLVSANVPQIRSAVVTLTKIGAKTVIGEGISHDYV